MSVYTSSLANHADVLTALLSKYKVSKAVGSNCGELWNLFLILEVEAEPGEFALYLVQETGERRIISESEFPLLVRVRFFFHLSRTLSLRAGD